jgi:hypothetical protein
MFKRGALLILALAISAGFLDSARAQQAVSAAADMTGLTLAAETSSTSTSTSSTSEVTSKSGPDIGTGIFSPFPFKLTLDVQNGYDDNVTTSNQFKQGSGFTEGGVSLSYDFGDARAQLNLEAGVSVTYYWQNISVPGFSVNDYDINSYLRFNGSYKASPRLTLSTNDYIAYLTEPDFSIAQGNNYRTSNYFYTQDKFTANYLWAPRFATATSYTLGVLQYADSQIGDFQDRVENTFGNEFRFLLAPTTALVAEYRYQIVSYQHISDRNSTTHFALGGIDHQFDPQLSVVFRGGAEFRDYDTGPSRTSPYFENTFTYIVGKRTNVSWILRYGLEEPGDAFSQTRETFRTGLAAKHDFTAKISADLGIYYEHDHYESFEQSGVVSPSFDEDSIDLAISLHYLITRNFGVEAGYNFTNVTSDIPAREYTRNRYWGGLNLVF